MFLFLAVTTDHLYAQEITKIKKIKSVNLN